MADIRCPMCGKANPPEAETCWSCQARLKPLLPSQPPSGANEGDGPDWLSGLRGGSEDSPAWPEDRGGEAEPAADTPDWLARIRQQQSQQSPAEQEPDWLSAISAEPSATPAGEQQTPPPPAAGEPESAPDWLTSLRPDQAAQPPAAGGQSQDEEDWMAGLSGWTAPVAAESGEPAAPEQPAPPAADQDWAGIFQTPGEPSGEPPAQPVDDNAGWMATLGMGFEPARSAGEEPPSVEPPAQPAPDAPDWLSAFSAEAAPGGETLSGPVTPDATPPAAAEETANASEGELSDWFSGLNLPGEESQSPAVSAAGSETPFGAVPAGSGPLMDAEPPAQPGETPDWLKAFGEPPASPPADEPPAVPAETPDWMRVFDEPAPAAPQSASEETTPPVMPFAGTDMPDWLGTGEEAAPSAKPAEEAASSGLEEAQLPGWLQAMRPMEAIAPVDTPAGSDDQAIVRAGPLAGMSGIVPGEDVVGKVRRPPVYSARLRVSENQRLQATLFEQMLSEEARPRPARAERSHLPQRIIRLLIALLLLVVTGLPMATGTQLMPLPDLFPPETVNFRARVEALPENAPVLLAVDYEPGLSEEMSLASASVMDHLIARKARLALLSTVPTGPVLADGLLASAVTRNAGFQLENSSVNLGYLPGGTAGLQEFASRPQVALQYQLNGETAWDQPALEGVSDIRKFALVIVMTENAETARAWIEQVQPRLGQVPLLFVISAQSAPFIHPYIDSGQVQGMVEGMAGGIAYARIARQPAAAVRFWDAYQFGIFAAVLLILVGVLWQTVRSLAQRKPDEKGA